MSSKQRFVLRAAFAAACLVTAAGASTFVAPRLLAQHAGSQAGTDRRFYADDPVRRDDDTRDIAPVPMVDLSKSYEFVNETFGQSVKSWGSALNVNTLGEVPDSSWFTNRIGVRDMSIDEIVNGPNQVDGPAPGMWHVTGRPDSGITPKFTIKDSRGDTYMIKLDPAKNPELPSSVEVISTKIFHALGYWVPEDTIVTFDISRLDVAPGAKIRTDTGDRRPITMTDVERWLTNTPKRADGRIRALASRYVPGKVVGQFRFTGTRSDDPNDIYPHERRRELRGMRVFAAWLNHDDARSVNSIDTYVEEGGRHYIRHYLQDFGSNLGSGSTSAQQPRGGNEYLIEGDKVAKGLVTFGFWRRDWTKVEYPANPSLGNIEAEFFQPAKWKTEYPQPAFDQMDDADAFWAASLASRFTNPMIEAFVATGELSDPAAARYLTEVIITRRDKVVSYWITRTNPLDRFAVEPAIGGALLTFDNAAVRVKAAQPGASYKLRWKALDNLARTARPVGDEMALDGMCVMVPAAAWGPTDDSGARYAVAAIRTEHATFPAWNRPVEVTLRDRGGVIDVVGIVRPASAGGEE
ncbi:MAG TPA: hypothetical protein VGQ37_05195 [Vicinamibacterales bacterium]|jgi:hypothetical protein|nr:hypothetical protein [Vicinamibacterales bacterium]